MARKTKAANLVIENTQPRAIFIPASGIHRTQMLVPGQNDVPKAHYDAVRKNPSVFQWVGLGYLVDHGEGVATAVASGFDGLSDGEARSQLAGISDARALRDLRDMTTSAALVDMANDRLRELLSTGGDASDVSE